MARAQLKTSTTERDALAGRAQRPETSSHHIDYRNLNRGEALAAWLSQFADESDRGLHPEHLRRVDRSWRRTAAWAAKPGGKY